MPPGCISRRRWPSLIHWWSSPQCCLWFVLSDWEKLPCLTNYPAVIFIRFFLRQKTWEMFSPWRPFITSSNTITAWHLGYRCIHWIMVVGGIKTLENFAAKNCNMIKFWMPFLLKFWGKESLYAMKKKTFYMAAMEKLYKRQILKKSDATIV